MKSERRSRWEVSRCRRSRQTVKTALIFLLIAACASPAEDESRSCEQLRTLMEDNSIPTKGVELREENDRVLMLRDGKAIGYQIEEVRWEPHRMESENLRGITAITYGMGQGEFDALGVSFRVDDPDEVALWVAAYAHQTEMARTFNAFIPVSKDAGFDALRVETKVFGMCMCSLGLRFYRGDEEVLILKGHFHEEPEFDSGFRNQALHVWSYKLAKKSQAEVARRRAEQAGLIEDPFADPQASPGNQDGGVGAVKPATGSEPDSEGGEEPQPEAEERSR